MKVRGCIPVKGRTVEGEVLDLPFHDADVSMPIISIATLSNDERYDVNFSKTGGVVMNNSTSQTSRFIKRAGVYFMKILVAKTKTPSAAPFGRQSNSP